MSVLSLGNITKDNGVLKMTGSIMLDTTPLVRSTVTVAADTAHNFALKDGTNNYGTLILDAEGNLTLKGGADLKDDITITDNTDDKVKLTQVDFSAPVSVAFDGTSNHKDLKVVNGSAGADSISVAKYSDTDFVLNTGAGNDTVVVETVAGKVNAGAGADLVSVTGANGDVALGAGKDTLVFGGAATVNLTDYSFNDDVIDLAEANTTLTADGKLISGTGSSASVVSGFTATNNLYLARIGNTSVDAATVLATAAEDTTKVNVDASAVKAKKLVINTAAADSANITLGKVNADITLNGTADAGVDTVKIGNTAASVSVNVTNFNTDDVLNFTGLTFNKTTIDAVGTGSDEITLVNSKVSVNLGNQATVAAAAVDGATTGVVAKFNLNGTTLYAATDSDKVIDLKEETDLSKILVKGTDTKTDANAIMTTAKWVDLSASNIYNINKVVLTGDTVAKASVVGTKNNDKAISINASAATDGVAIWANNSSTTQNDMISLSSSTDAVDTLWFGTADGKDSVSNFTLASDILYLYDANVMTADQAVLKVGKAEMSIGAATENKEEIMQVQGAKFAGTVYAAGDFVDSTGDKVINLGDNAAKVNYYAVAKDAFVSVASSEDINYAFLKTIDYAGYSKANIADKGSVASIDASGVTSTDSKIIIEGVANVTLGAGTNEVWANVKDANVVLANGAGIDKVYFGGADKNVTVANYDNTSDSSDVIALMGTIDKFTATQDAAGNAVISNAAKGKMTLDGISGVVNLVDEAGAKFKLYTADEAYTTNDDGTNIYLGTNLTADSSVTNTTTIVEAEGVNKWGLTSSAIVGKTVRTIDMSGSSADFVLVGSANAANTITGGTGTNYLNGGGASKDVLNGVTGAVDNFYYGKEDGNDTIVNIGAEDIVQLYDVATADLATVSVKDDKAVITLKNDSKLTITNSIADGTTFVLTDGTYVFDSSVEGNWVKKEV